MFINFIYLNISENFFLQIVKKNQNQKSKSKSNTFEHILYGKYGDKKFHFKN